MPAARYATLRARTAGSRDADSSGQATAPGRLTDRAAVRPCAGYVPGRARPPERRLVVALWAAIPGHSTATTRSGMSSLSSPR